jgi:hypothetical protein
MRELLLARARGEHEKSSVIKSLQRAAINTQNPNVKFGRQAREHGAKLRRPSRDSGLLLLRPIDNWHVGRRPNTNEKCCTERNAAITISPGVINNI